MHYYDLSKHRRMQFIKWNLTYLAFAKYVCRLHNIKIYQNHSNHQTRGCQYPLFYVVFTRNETKIIQNKSHISHKTSRHVSDILWQHFCLISLHYYSLSFLLKKTQENVFRKKNVLAHIQHAHDDDTARCCLKTK